MSPTILDVDTAAAFIGDGASLAVGGFGLCGIPSTMIEAIRARGTRDLHVVSNTCGVDDWGLGLLMQTRQISKVTASYVGENKQFERQYLAGELEVELVPQGTLAERLRAAGVGIPAFYTPTGAGTLVADGGMPMRYASDGSVAKTSPPKEIRHFDGREYLLEPAIGTDFGLVRASVADRAGNLMFDATTRNFNPLCAMAGAVTIAEVERLVEVGEIPADQIHLPGIFVQHLVELTPAQASSKRIEKLRVHTAPAHTEMG